MLLREVEEKGHMGHPDFRVRGKIFATLGYPDAGWGMVKLTPEEQRAYLQAHPEMFAIVRGAPGERGCTLVRLAAADPGVVGEALHSAWASNQRKAPTGRKR